MPSPNFGQEDVPVEQEREPHQSPAKVAPFPAFDTAPRSLRAEAFPPARNEFPLVAKFRSPPRNKQNNYKQWVDAQLMPGEHAVDVQTNVLRFEPGNWPYANRFAQEHPGTVLLSTWRAAGGVPQGADYPGDPLALSAISFPGHWVTAPGTLLSAGIRASSTTLRVRSTENMERGPALLVEVDSVGNERWNRFEYVLITSVGNRVVKVKRKYNGSPAARAFSRSTAVRPLPWDRRSRTDYVVWFFDFTKYCPRDRSGRTAADIIAKEMLDPMKPGGPLDRIGGIDLASGPLTAPPENADYDRDGRVDSESVYYEGIEAFYGRIRDVLGPHRYLTTSLDCKYVGLLNGVNQEGLAGPRDPWNQVAATVNNVLAWRKLSPLPMLSLAFQQYYSGREKYLRVQLQRFLVGYSACLGMASDVTGGKDNDIEGINALNLIELYKGDAMEPRWLGKAIGMQRTALATPNILGNAQSNKDWRRIIPALTAKRGSLSVQGNTMVLTPPSDGHTGYTTLSLDFSLPRRSDVTVFMEVVSDDDQLDRRILVPHINVPTDTEGDQAKFTSRGYVPLAFLFRGARRRPEGVTIDFRFGKGGPIRFQSLSVHAGTDGLACEFERGVVLVNPSLEDETFDLTRLFRNRRGFRRIPAPETFATLGGVVDGEFRPQLRQAMQLNNGRRVADKISVPVPERNALFLIANPVKATTGTLEVNGFGLSAPTADDTDYTLALVCRSGGSCGKLDKCQGDCDSDDDCAGDLLCFQRNKRTTTSVLGCRGTASGGFDYCVDENDYPKELRPYIGAKPNGYKNRLFS